MSVIRMRKPDALNKRKRKTNGSESHRLLPVQTNLTIRKSSRFCDLLHYVLRTVMSSRGYDPSCAWLWQHLQVADLLFLFLSTCESREWVCEKASGGSQSEKCGDKSDKCWLFVGGSIWKYPLSLDLGIDKSIIILAVPVGTTKCMTPMEPLLEGLEYELRTTAKYRILSETTKKKRRSCQPKRKKERIKKRRRSRRTSPSSPSLHTRLAIRSNSSSTWVPIMIPDFLPLRIDWRTSYEYQRRTNKRTTEHHFSTLVW